MSTAKGLNNLCVAAFESRMAQEMETLITRYDGKPLVAPSMREIPLEDNPQVLTFGEQLLARQWDMVIVLTGVGLRQPGRSAQNSILSGFDQGRSREHDIGREGPQTRRRAQGTWPDTPDLRARTQYLARSSSGPGHSKS